MERTQEKLNIVRDHLGHVTSIDPLVVELDKNCPVKVKYDYFRLDGWGFKDTSIVYNKKNKEGIITGTHYSFAGIPIKDLYKFAKEDILLDLDAPIIPSQISMEVDPPYINEEFLSSINGFYSRLSFDNRERIMHSHGHTLREVFILKHGKFERFADCVVYPTSHEDVEGLVKAAVKHNVVLIPYCGGTNVTQALMLSAKEKRMIVSVDMARV